MIETSEQQYGFRHIFNNHYLKILLNRIFRSEIQLCKYPYTMYKLLLFLI